MCRNIFAPTYGSNTEWVLCPLSTSTSCQKTSSCMTSSMSYTPQKTIIDHQHAVMENLTFHLKMDASHQFITSKEQQLLGSLRNLTFAQVCSYNQPTSCSTKSRNDLLVTVKSSPDPSAIITRIFLLWLYLHSDKISICTPAHINQTCHLKRLNMTAGFRFKR